MKLVQLVGSHEGRMWYHTLPDKASLFTHVDRVLVVSPGTMYWLMADGETKRATAYPKVYEDNGN